MKRNYLIKNKSRLSLLMGLLATTLLSSCLKDKSPGTIDFSKSPALVGFQYKGFSNVPMVTAIYGLPTDSTGTLEVTLSVASLTLSSPVTLDIVPDDAYINTYNTANGTSYVQLPTSDYTLGNSGHITIKPGQQIVKVSLHFAGQNVNFNQSNALALKITNVSGATLASNLSEIIFPIVLKSVYAGQYSVSSVRHHPTLGNFSASYNAEMATIDKTTIGGPALADLQSELTLHINADNTVDVSADDTSQPSAQNSPGLSNTYDPAAKTFSLHYFYNTGAPRTIVQTMVFLNAN